MGRGTESFRELRNKVYKEMKSKQEEFDKHFNYTNYSHEELTYININ
jgi:hypothetical protein